MNMAFPLLVLTVCALCYSWWRSACPSWRTIYTRKGRGGRWKLFVGHQGEIEKIEVDKRSCRRKFASFCIAVSVERAPNLGYTRDWDEF